MAILDKKQKRKVLNLKVYCNNKELCSWFGNLGELEQHLTEKCQFVLADCSYSCGQMMMKLHLEDHEANYCLKRPHSCEYCQLKGTYQDIQEDHVPVCPKYPVTCPNECEATSLLRAQLKQHLEECPLAMVECELREVGCEEMVQRKDLDRHMEEAAHKHLRLSTSYFLKNQARQDEDMAKLRQENDKLQRDMTIMIREVGSLKQYLQKHDVYLSVNYRQFYGPWINNESFKTFSGCTMKINLHKRSNILDIELVHVESAAIDDSLKWPKIFSMKVILLNQVGDHNHHEVSGNYLQVRKGKYNNNVCIRQEVVENPLPGVQYIVDGHIKMEITVAEK